MTRNITLAVAALLCSVVFTQYLKAPIDYKSNLDCTSCIRGGYNYCLTLNGTSNNTTIEENCEQKDRNPNAYISNYTGPNDVVSGHVCSRALKDEMNFIVGTCKPDLNQNDDCGSYLINLSSNNTFSVERSIINLPHNRSCTYRVYSECGYPMVSWRTNDPNIAEDFDIAWATMDGLYSVDELDRW